MVVDGTMVVGGVADVFSFWWSPAVNGGPRISLCAYCTSVSVGRWAMSGSLGWGDVAGARGNSFIVRCGWVSVVCWGVVSAMAEDVPSCLTSFGCD